MLNLKDKKAVSLLRVSTSKQTTKDDKDIPTQRDLVNEFIEKNKMVLIREFIEGGVSGYKTKLSKRDALQTIKRMADHREFDVLVVYKSDRIGRTTDESPLVIKYLNDNNIRIFSVDGQELKTETLMDELITYLEFWRNKGESVKLSERAVDYKRMAVMNGKYTGGGKKMIPFGYRVVNKGSTNEKGKNILDFEIDPDNAKIVEKIFDLSIRNNMGARAIAKWLNENRYGDKSKNKEYWSFRTISYMLNNPIYKGYFHMEFESIDEKVISPQQEHLIIIPGYLWEENQKKIKKRKKVIKKKPEGITSSRVLLSGLVYCGHCGEKTNVWANHKYYTKKNGEKTKYVVDCYKCPSSLRYNGNNCDGQKTYSAKKIDSIVEEQIIGTIKELSYKKLSEDFKDRLQDNLNKLLKNKDEKIKELENKQKQVIILKKEIPLAMIGDSNFSEKELKESLGLIQEDVNKLLKYIDDIDEKITQSQTAISKYNVLDTGIDMWEEKYKESDIIEKKALISQIVDRIDVYRDKIVVSYKITFETFKKESKNNDNSVVNCSSLADRFDTTHNHNDFAIEFSKKTKFA